MSYFNQHLHFSSKFETMLFALCLNESGKASMRTLLEVRKGHFNFETNSIVVYPTIITVIVLPKTRRLNRQALGLRRIQGSSASFPELPSSKPNPMPPWKVSR